MSEGTGGYEHVHMWRLRGVSLDEGAWSEYECDLCGVLLLVGPGEVHPDEC